MSIGPGSPEIVYVVGNLYYIYILHGLCLFQHKGIKGASPLFVLPTFDPSKSPVIDWMHCVLLGVVKQMLGLWLSASNKTKEYYIGAKVQWCYDIGNVYPNLT